MDAATSSRTKASWTAIRFSRLLALASLALPLLLALSSLERGRAATILSIPFATIALVSVLLALALVTLRGIALTITISLAIVLLPEYVLRGGVLLIDPRTFIFPAFPISPDHVTSALIIAFATFACFALGLAWAGRSRLRPRPGAQAPAARFTTPEGARYVVVLCAVALLTQLILALGLKDSIVGTEADRFGWIARLVPVPLVILACMFVMVRDGRWLSPVERTLFVAILVASVLSILLSGSRGAIVPIALAYLLVRVALEGDPLLDARVLAILAAGVISFLLFFIDAGQAVRESWNVDGHLSGAALVARYGHEFSQHSWSLYAILERISQYTAGFDHLAVWLAHPRPDALASFSLWGFILTVIGAFIPGWDPFVSGLAIPITRFHPLTYRGATLAEQHSEAWGLPAQAWILFGVAGLLVVLLFGAFLGLALRACFGRSRRGRRVMLTTEAYARERENDVRDEEGRLLGGAVAAFVLQVATQFARSGVMEGGVVDDLATIILVVLALAAWRGLRWRQAHAWSGTVPAK